MASRCTVEDLDVTEFSTFLEQKGLSESVTTSCKASLVNGATFMLLHDEDLKELAPLMGDRVLLREVLKEEKKMLHQERPTQIDEASADTDFSASCNHIILEPEDNDHRDGDDTQANSNWHLAFKIPEKSAFSGAVQSAIDSGVISSKSRRDIIQMLRTLMVVHERKPSGEQYNTVCRNLIRKFPKLHDGGSSGFGSWKLSLRNSFKNFRKDKLQPSASGSNCNAGQRKAGDPPGKKVRRTMPYEAEQEQLTEEDYERHVEEIRDECKKKRGVKNWGKIKELMEVTRARRWQWIVDDKPLVQEVTKKFPPLRFQKTLRREFCWVAEVGQADSLMESWPMHMKKLLAFFKLEAENRPTIKRILATIDENVEEPHKDCVIFELLMKILYPKGTAKGAVFMKKFEENDVDLDAEVLCIEQAAPYLLISGAGSSETVQYYIVCENMVIYEPKSFKDAILDIICTYYTFNISYVKPLSGIFLFIQHFMFNLKDSQPQPPCLCRLVNSLNKITI